MSLSKERLLSFYETMNRIRKFEEQAKESFAVGDVQGFVHLSNGEEAVPTGVSACLNENDYITSTHRGHGHVIAKGADLKIMLAELCGRVDGYNKGKGGSMHIANRKLGILGANGIVGAGQVIAAGSALASKIKKDGKVTICYFGDGASNEGTFHEALNFAAVHKLPVVFACSNNMYAISTRFNKSSNNINIADRAIGYGIPGAIVDGNDVEKVYEETKKAVARARNGEGPTLMEYKTFKKRGHYEGDPAPYRPEEELDEWMRRDPIVLLRNRLIDEGLATEDEVAAVEKKTDDEIKAALEFALKSPFADEASVLKDLYSDIVEEGK